MGNFPHDRDDEDNDDPRARFRPSAPRIDHPVTDLLDKTLQTKPREHLVVYEAEAKEVGACNACATVGALKGKVFVIEARASVMRLCERHFDLLSPLARPKKGKKRA